MATDSEAMHSYVDTLRLEQKIAIVEAALTLRTPSAADIEVINRPDWVQSIRRGTPSPLMNRVWLSRLSDAEADERIVETIATYQSLNLPLMWMLSPSSRPKNLAERLEARGFRHLVNVRGMLARVDDLVCLGGATRQENTTVEIVNAANIEEWLALYARAWNVDETTKDVVRKEMTAQFDQPTESHFAVVARYRGEACGAASVAVFDHFGLLLNAFVDPEVRRRGIFRSMVMARASILRERSIPYAVIHALEQTAAPLVRRMGFEDVCEMSAYTYP